MINMVANLFNETQVPEGQPVGLLGKKDSQPGSMPMEELQRGLRDISRRLRVLEERYSSVRRSLQVNEQNMLKESKKNITEIKAFSSEISEVKKDIRTIGEELKQIIRELKQTVKKDEARVLERYVSLWQPMNYVTHTEMDKRIKDIVRDELSKNRQ